MSLLLALTAAVAPPPASNGGVTRRPYRGGRVFEKLDPVEVEPQEEAPQWRNPGGPNELLFESIRARQVALIAQAEALRQQQVVQQAQAAIAKAAADARQAAQVEALLIELQAELQRIEDEIEAMDLAFIVAMLD